MTAQPQIPNITPLGRVLPGIQTIPFADYRLTANVPATLDLVVGYLNGQVEAIQSIYIDNSINDGIVIAKSPRTGQTALCPANFVGWFPLFVPAPAQIELTFFPIRATTLGATLQLAVSNAFMSQTPFMPISPPLSLAAFTSSLAGVTTLIPGVAGQTIRVFSLVLGAGDPGAFDQEILIQSNATPIGARFFLNNSTTTIILPRSPSDTPWYETIVGEALKIAQSAPITTSAQVQYRQSA